LSFSEYAYAVSNEAADRASGHIRGIEDYLKLTHLTSGVYPSFAATEAGLNIPDKVMAHPALKSLCGLAVESLILTNVGISLACKELKYLTWIARICTRTISSKLPVTVDITSLRSL
jgi:hypothetical protein